jgi:hypothetical protein
MAEPAQDEGEARLIQRAANAEANGRRINEAIERGGGAAVSAVFVCECGYVGCNATVELSIDDYEAVRTDFDRFLVVPGHEIDEVDEVLERHQRHLVVVKRGREAREIVRATDSREP